MPVLRRLVLAAALLSLVVGAPAAAPEERTLTGGPLAGLDLPPNPRGQWGEVEISPDSPEHYRAYMSKYVPVRSFFDRQSLLRSWVVPAIPGAVGKQVEQFCAPIYQLNQSTTGGATGRFAEPVPVVRCRVQDPVFRLDLGELDAGLYAVRVIGAVATEKLRRFREPLYLAMRVNDGLKGETSTYRLRAGYVDDFYSIAEFYFHAPEKRRFQAEVWVDRGSTVDLLVNHLTLDDVLAGTIRRPLKPRATGNHQPVPAPAASALSPDERLARDEAIWKWLPPINAQGEWLDMNVPMPGVTYGVPDASAADLGAWQHENDIGGAPGQMLTRDPKQWDAFLVNKKLGLRYTVDDLIARRPLPDPFPYKDDGAGLFFPSRQAPGEGYLFAPISHAVGMRLRGGFAMALNGSLAWRRTGDPDTARDAAVSLIRFAYQYPAIDAANWLTCITVQPGAYDRDLRCRQREECARWMPHYENYLLPLAAYDTLYDTIRGNEELAASVRRFVPWVRTSADLIQLLDVYLVQTEAKRIMRYHDHTKPMALAEVATVMGDRQVTDPWMEWLFSRTFMYPLDPCGIQDLMISGCDRNGAQYIGSTFYAQGEGASANAAGLERYIAAGGNPKYDLSDPEKYPKPLAHCRWQLNTVIAGQDFARIGDVCGPDKRPGATLAGIVGAARRGWAWSAGADACFAWVLKNLVGRGDESDEAWAAVDRAAAGVPRAPWLSLHSRVVSNWFGALEAGREHDDFRFRRAAYVRTGMGIGHQHADTLDLQMVAHGMPMTIDGGQRSGYSKPNDRFSRIHNVVEVNGQGNEEFGLRSHAWVQALTDAPGAAYLQANAVPPNGARLFRRQVALIDVDEGAGSSPLAMEQQKPGARLAPGVTTANSYAFDVFRVSGGQAHAYCFHGTVNDEFQWNAAGAAPVPSVPGVYDFSTDEKYLSIFPDYPGGKMAGDAPETLEATWRCTRDGKMGSEQQMLGANYDEAAPRKLTRLHLLGAAGLRALSAESASTQFGYHYTNLVALRRGAGLESAFTALIEPYAGEPFITGRRVLDVGQNETDALRAVAVEVKTRNGHTDICFADGRPEKERQVPDAGVRVSGEFALYSTDAGGLRQASLAGGTLLEAPEVRLVPAARERTARVTAADYRKRTLILDAPWPAACAGRVFEIGSPERTTCYTAMDVAPEGAGTRITLDEGADAYRSPIRRVDPATGRVDCVLGFSLGMMKGLTHHWVAGNDDLTKVWRADQVDGGSFRLTGAPVTQADFAPSNALRLWEYGAGDTVRQSTFASIRRVAPGLYEVSGDVDLTVSLKATSILLSPDASEWQPLAGTPKGAWFEARVTAAQLAGGAVLVQARR